MSTATMTRPVTAVTRRARPMPYFERAVVSQDEVGEWLCDGVAAQCNLGWHDGAARAMAEALDVWALLQAASPVDRARMDACAKLGFNSVEELWAMRDPRDG